MKKIFFITIIMTVLILTGCQPGSAAERMNMNDSKEIHMVKFTPPADGLITEKQSDRYIAVAKDLNNAIMEQVNIMQDFYSKHGISGKEEIETLKDNEGAMKEWDAIIKSWENKEKTIYEKNKMSSEEFDWIAASLIDEKNKAIQQKIEKQLMGE